MSTSICECVNMHVSKCMLVCVRGVGWVMHNHIVIRFAANEFFACQDIGCMNGYGESSESYHLSTYKGWYL